MTTMDEPTAKRANCNAIIGDEVTMARDQEISEINAERKRKHDEVEENEGNGTPFVSSCRARTNPFCQTVPHQQDAPEHQMIHNVCENGGAEEIRKELSLEENVQSMHGNCMFCMRIGPASWCCSKCHTISRVAVRTEDHHNVVHQFETDNRNPRFIPHVGAVTRRVIKPEVLARVCNAFETDPGIHEKQLNIDGTAAITNGIQFLGWRPNLEEQELEKSCFNNRCHFFEMTTNQKCDVQVMKDCLQSCSQTGVCWNAEFYFSLICV